MVRPISDSTKVGDKLILLSEAGRYQWTLGTLIEKDDGKMLFKSNVGKYFQINGTTRSAIKRQVGGDFKIIKGAKNECRSSRRQNCR